MYIGQDRKIGGTSVPPAPLASLAPLAILENPITKVSKNKKYKHKHKHKQNAIDFLSTTTISRSLNFKGNPI